MQRETVLQTVAGIFRIPTMAHQAIEDLRASGVDPQQLSVVANRASMGELARAISGELPVGAIGGTGLAAVLGAAASYLVSAGALTIPGVGPAVVAGPIAAALGMTGTTPATDAGDTVAIGDLRAALVGWGIAAAEAREYEAQVAGGAILLAVTTPDDATATRAAATLHHAGADRVTFNSAGQ
ncbi:MAG TPA: hypothetical protein VGJ87_13085 [Roseiflexaceae bacterium]